MTLEIEVRRAFGLAAPELQRVSTPVNDVLRVRAGQEMFALKIYHAKRTPAAVRWEVDLLRHLRRLGAPVIAPVERRGEAVQILAVDGTPRPAVLYPWAPGGKPQPSPAVYANLGAAAARIHRAADTFTSTAERDRYDAPGLVDDQLRRMSAHLVAAGRWHQALALGSRLRRLLADEGLDRGVCHMDLTLDNVHVDGDQLMVFDFDSAGVCWRALEPHGVLALSEDFFAEWLTAYRGVRPFRRTHELAVRAFTVIGDLRVVARQLGVAESSRGEPLRVGQVGQEDQRIARPARPRTPRCGAAPFSSHTADACVTVTSLRTPTSSSWRRRGRRRARRA